MVDWGLAGKVALVTGSTRGIGRAIAEGLATGGARVWVHGRSQAACQSLAAAIGGRYVAADLADPAAVGAIVAPLAQEETCLDILVNNAGMEVVMPVTQWDMATLDRIWQVNARAAIDLTQRCLPLLREAAAASIINVTSIHDRVPYPHNGAYALSKAALAMFTATAAVELAPLGLRINNLAPGAIETEMNREVLDTMGRDHFAHWIPLGRVGTTAEVVGPALFLASAASSYMTGATLYADGGYMHNLVRYRLATEAQHG